jgi:hypothetical protein
VLGGTRERWTGQRDGGDAADRKTRFEKFPAIDARTSRRYFFTVAQGSLLPNSASNVNLKISRPVQPEGECLLRRRR